MIDMYPNVYVLNSITLIKVKRNGKSNYDYESNGVLLFGLTLRQLKQVIFCGVNNVDLEKIDCFRTLKSFCKRFLNNAIVQFE